jgi:NADH-quinone oxidoreductase subunit C
MNSEQLKEKLVTLFPEAEISENKQFLFLTIDAANVGMVAEKLKTDKALLFDYLFCVTGTDHPTYLTVTYHLESTEFGHKLVLKAKTFSREKPEIRTVSNFWPTAEFHEREISEMFGINFINHPDPRKLLLPDNWNGYPMLKDYHDPVNIIELE